MGIFEDIEKANRQQDEILKSFYSDMATSDLVKSVEDIDIEKGVKTAIGEIHRWADGKNYRRLAQGGEEVVENKAAAPKSEEPEEEKEPATTAELKDRVIGIMGEYSQEGAAHLNANQYLNKRRELGLQLMREEGVTNSLELGTWLKTNYKAARKEKNKELRNTDEYNKMKAEMAVERIAKLGERAEKEIRDRIQYSGEISVTGKETKEELVSKLIAKKPYFETEHSPRDTVDDYRR